MFEHSVIFQFEIKAFSTVSISMGRREKTDHLQILGDCFVLS